MTELEFDEVAKVLAGLWPRYQLTADLRVSHQRILGPARAEDVTEMLRAQYREDPDSSRPKWKPIYAELKRARTGDGGNDFDSLLRACREALRKQGHGPAEHWTDEQVFGNHLDANDVLIMQRRERKGEIEPEEELRLSRRSRSGRASTATYWRYYLQDVRAEVPYWLDEIADSFDWDGELVCLRAEGEARHTGEEHDVVTGGQGD